MCLQVKMHEKRDEIDRLRRYGNFDVQYLMSFVEGLLRQFEIQWPGENKVSTSSIYPSPNSSSDIIIESSQLKVFS